MTTCDLCGLPTGEDPITDEEGGTFCCRGCLTVSTQFDSVDTSDPSSIDSERIRSVLTDDSGPDQTRQSDDRATGVGDHEEAVTFLRVDGMHCATCEAFLEVRATAVEGVTGADASYPTDMLRVRYDPGRVDGSSIPDAVSGYSYRARPVTDDDPRRDETPWRLLVGGFFGMMVMMWYLLFLYPAYAGVVPVTEATWGHTGRVSLINVWIATTVVLAVTGYPILRGAYVSLRAGVPNMDLLVSLALLGAYSYSAVAAILGEVEVYFDVVVVIALAVSVGRYYEDRIKRRATGRLEELAKGRVMEARVHTSTGWATVSVAELERGDTVLVRPGERIPVDGTVAEGTAAVDESVITGESFPVERDTGDEVVAGAVVMDAPLRVTVNDPQERTVDRILARLWDLQSSRRGAGQLADRLAAVFVPVVILLAVIGTGAHLWLGSLPQHALLAGLAVLVVACPCALGLATPLAVAAGMREALGRGVIVRDPGVFEVAPTVEVIAIDKTGTLTTGEMRVVEEPADETSLRRAGAVEALSAHPIAEAIAARVGSTELETSNFVRHPGRGAEATVAGDRVLVGSLDLILAEGWSVPDVVRSRVESMRDRGTLPVVVGWQGAARDVIGVGDNPRPDWGNLLTTLGTDRTVAILTGDDDRATTVFRDHPAVDHILAGLPPEAKAEAVSRLRSIGPVAMVGDGTNDAPAMAAADLGVAVGTGAALTADAADVVLTGDGLGDLDSALRIATATRRRIRENLGWAFLYNGVAIPAALFGVLDPLVAAGAMAASSLLVVTNSARSLGPRPDGGSEEIADRPGPSPRDTTAS